MSATGCPESSRLLQVGLRTDFRPGADFDRVEVALFVGDEERIAATRTITVPAARIRGGLEGSQLAEFEALPAGRWLVRARLMLGSEPVASGYHSLTLGDDPFGLTIIVSRACVDVQCPGDGDPESYKSCLEGQCVPRECSPETPSRCPTMECTSDGECEVPAGAPACAVGVCLAGTCAPWPDDGQCGGGQCLSDGCSHPDGDGGMPERDAGVCANTPCRLAPPQCGCPTGQACYLASETRFCANPGAIPFDEACTGVGSCVPGAICLNVSQNPAVTAPMCRRFCETDTDCAGGACVLNLFDDGGEPLPGATFCSTACDPVDRTGCPDGTMCGILYNSVTGRLITDCYAPPGTRRAGDPCTNLECGPGLACQGGECRTLCKNVGLQGEAGGCPDGLTCAGDAALVLGGTPYGICRSPT